MSKEHLYYADYLSTMAQMKHNLEQIQKDTKKGETLYETAEKSIKEAEEEIERARSILKEL